ncbi:MAG: c-type cytochrome [Rhodospirillales bacterium]|nr:c-type cytochrome [Rhodospirillales bacterium]
MSKSWLLIAAATLALSLAGPAQAGDAAAGEAKAKSCASCHGPDGEGVKDNPPIAGMDEGAFVAALAAYKDGSKEHKMMNMLSKKLSDEDMANLAAYYATLK